MKSKWEYIRYACKELGYEEAAGIADEIETLLKDIYGDTKTIAWMRDYIGIKGSILTASNIYILSGSIRYCIACVEENINCNACRFSKRSYGLVSQFMDVLCEEGGID